MTLKAAIVAACLEHPDWPAPKIAQAANCTKSYVRAVKSMENLALSDYLWRADEITTLTRLRMAGRPYKIIARQFPNRSIGALKSKMRHLRKPRPFAQDGG